MSAQIEDGYTRIANELFDNLIKLHLSGNEWAIVHCVMRQTWGWRKKVDRISLTQFTKHTGINRSSVNKAIKSLVAKQILVAKQQPSGNEYQIQKDYTKWTSCRIDTSCRFATTPVAKQQPVATSSEVVAKQQHTKEIKENIQKKTNTKVLVAEAKPLTKKNPYVEIVLSEFQNSFSFRPTDKKPRFVAHNFSKNIQAFLKVFNPEITEARFTKVIQTYLDWLLTQDYANKIETLDLVRRKFPIWADPQVTSYQKGRNATTGK